MQNTIYQLMHPWHWLTYGQNAAAMASIAAVLGLIGLYFYTRYTRRMMKLGEEVRRAGIIPILAPRSQIEFQPSDFDQSPASEMGLTPPIVTEYCAVLRIRNIGEGAAIFLNSWHQPVSKIFVLDDSSLLGKSEGVAVGIQELSELLKGESTEVRFPGFKTADLDRRWLFVVDSIDHTNAKHQLRFLRSGLSNGETSVSMAHEHRGTRSERSIIPS